MSSPHVHSVQIYYEDTDHSGLVYHANYLRYFERAREHIFGVDELVRLYAEEGIGFVVYKAEVTFKAGAVFGDTVVDEQFATGEWAALGTDEMRGFVGWGMDSPDGTTFGWMDVGWDGEVLSIYDWAFSTNGSIAAGQTSEVSAVPGGTGLAALAMGAAGLRRRRNRSA